MDQLRKLHNSYKRELIEYVCKENYEILDVGCGFGGDLQKWNKCRVVIHACEPDERALNEAKRRSKNMRIDTIFFNGDIMKCPYKKYDVICYNFSLQYIFNSKGLFFKTINAIRDRLKPNGKLVGIIPDSEYIIARTPLKDELGNYFLVIDISGYFGDTVDVYLTDTPYYNNGHIPEPIAYKDLLVTHLKELGLELELWEHLYGSQITEMYSKFIFVYSK